MGKLKDSLVYDPLCNRIDFNKRLVTDYKHNKRINLPKPASNDLEFECERRRRLYLDKFREYKIETEAVKRKKKRRDGKMKRKEGQEINNLSPKEIQGLKSLKKRIKEGEIMVSKTDKSGKLAVVTREQYIESGKCHTSKDTRIGWKEIKYLQNQINNHTWWVSSIVGNCKESNPERMCKNI